MPEPADTARERKRLADEAARRRSAVNLLRITACACDYASERLSNGASPAEAAETVVFVSGEMAEVAEALRRLALVSPAERRVRAVQLAQLGMSREEIAARLGVSERSVRSYLKPDEHRGTDDETGEITTARQGARRGARPAGQGAR